MSSDTGEGGDGVAMPRPQRKMERSQPKKAVSSALTNKRSIMAKTQAVWPTEVEKHSESAAYSTAKTSQSSDRL